MGLSSPLPWPRTARRSGCKGARNAREPATNPCSPTGANGSHLRSFASDAKVGKGEQKMRPRSRDAPPVKLPDTCGRLRVSPVILGGTDPTGTHPWLWGQSEIGNAAVKTVSEPNSPQADRLSRFFALIWAMSMGPSENSPSPAFRVNSRK